MGDYSKMAEYYNIIMTSGYYDYSKVAENILEFYQGGSILEVGCGTGLILEKLIKQRKINKLTGIDLTQSMLDIAHDNLKYFDNIFLLNQNVVTLSLEDKYDLAFSYGGPWYFVRDNQEFYLISHICNNADNEKGIEQLSNHIYSGGRLLLGIQGPHYDYDKEIVNGMTYAQKIRPTANGFIKDYYLLDKDKIVMSQTLNYRIYDFDDVIKMLANYGLEYQPGQTKEKYFIEFKKN
ncbi:MAG: class I SAM-dependent methyltransferase [Cyanobacteria bacterium P01_D01_bin.50]